MMSEKIIQDLITTLNSKLDVIIKLMVLLKVQDKSQSEQIWLLSAAGLQPKQIASIVGTTANTVRVNLFSLRKEKAKVKRVHGKGGGDRKRIVLYSGTRVGSSQKVVRSVGGGK